jgi:hypothetical protein
MAEPSPVLLVKRSADSKLSFVDLVENDTPRLRPEPRPPYIAATYVSIEATCPDHCAFKASGCYVREGFTARTSDRLDDGARHTTGDVVNYLEAEAIRKGWGGKRGIVPDDGTGRPLVLRLHISGDVFSVKGARWLAVAALDYQRRGGGPVFGYTRRWNEVPRHAWGVISILASCTTPAEMHLARARGYVPALTVAKFPSHRAFVVDGLKVVPCPEETTKGKVRCVSCRLCIDRDLIQMNVAIAFEVHGRGAASARQRLPVLTSAPATRGATPSPASVAGADPSPEVLA